MVLNPYKVTMNSIGFAIKILPHSKKPPLFRGVRGIYMEICKQSIVGGQTFLPSKRKEIINNRKGYGLQ